MLRKEPFLEPKFFFGLTVGQSNNCFFVNDDKIAYHAAGVIVVHDTSNNTQEFVYLNDVHKIITTMDINNRKGLIAVAETGKKPSVGIYSLTKRRHMQQLTVAADSKATGLVKIKFVFDDVHLAVLTGDPDYIMYYYNLKHSQVKSSVRVIHPPSVVGPVYDMALNPAIAGVCCFVGKGLFRTMAMGDSAWKQYGFHRANKFEFTTVCWLNKIRVLAGTADGRLFLVENGELRAVYNVQTLWDFDPSVAIPNPLGVRPLFSRKQEAVQVQFCTPYKGGLMFVVDDYQIYHYKINEDQKSYVKSAVYVVSERPEMPAEEEVVVVAAAAEKTDGGDEDGRVEPRVRSRRPNPINTLCVSPKTARILCATDTRLYFQSTVERLSSMSDERLADGSESPPPPQPPPQPLAKSSSQWSPPQWSPSVPRVTVEPLGEQLHVGGVGGLSVCAWKPLFMTCGRRDRTVKLWDHRRRALLLSARYAGDDVLDVALHPCGLYAVLVFRGRAVFVTVHGPADGLRPRAEFVATGSATAAAAGEAQDGEGGGGGGGLARFSAAGHMFAVTDGPDVHVYCSITFRRRFTVAGIHRATITDLSWAADDWQLYTCDADGRVCQFDLYHGRHATNVLVDDQVIHGIAVTEDLTQIYTVSQDGRLRKMFHWVVTRNQNLQHGALYAILLSRSNSMLLATCQRGGILSLSLPMESSEIEFREFALHNQTISKMRLTADDTTLITCSVDGSICVWDVRDADQEKMSAMLPDDVIVSRGEFKRRVDTAAALDAKLERLTRQSAVDTVALTREYGRRLRELDERRRTTADREEYHLQEAIVLHEACKTSLDNRIIDMKEKHELDMKTVKDDYEKKLIYEDNKYANFENDTRNMEEEMEKKKEMVTKAHEEQMEALADKFNKAVKEKEDVFEKFKKQFDSEKISLDQEIDEFDDQCDRDLLKLQMNFEPKIKKYSDQNKKLQKEISICKSKIKSYQKSREDFIYLIDKYREDIAQMRSHERSLDLIIAKKNAEARQCNQDLQNKDAWMRADRLNMVEVETKISELKLIEEKWQKLMQKQQNIFNSISPNIIVTKFLLVDMVKYMQSAKMKCDQLKQTIRTTTSKVKKTDKLIRQKIAFMKITSLDLYFVHLDAKHDVSKLHDYLIGLSHRFEKGNGGDDTHLFKQRRSLEKCAAVLEGRETALARRKQLNVRRTKENSELNALVNRLRRETAVNRNKYEQRSSEHEQRRSGAVELSADSTEAEEDWLPSIGPSNSH